MVSVGDMLSAQVNVVRDPRWGRNLETPSEDPTVCGGFGVEVTKGLQESKSDPRFVQAVVSSSTSALVGFGFPQDAPQPPTSTPATIPSDHPSNPKPDTPTRSLTPQA